MDKDQLEERRAKKLKIRMSLIYMARLTHSVKQHEDSLSYVKRLVRLMRGEFEGMDLTSEEKLLFNAGYRNILMMKRRQWRSIFTVFDAEERKEIFDEKKPEEMQKDYKLKCILLTKKRIEHEIRELCKDVYTEARYFLRMATSAESRVFYLKMLADTFRYLSQIETGQVLIRIIEETNKRYLKAMAEAEIMENTSPLKLALSLNYSTYKYEIEQNFEAAVEIANTAF